MSGYVTIFATQLSNPTALQVSKKKIKADFTPVVLERFQEIKYAGSLVATNIFW